MKIIVVGAVLILAAAAATYARYESFDPCRWIEHDMARKSGLPAMVVQAQIKAQFLLNGVTDPDPYTCLQAWWKMKAETPPGAAS